MATNPSTSAVDFKVLLEEWGLKQYISNFEEQGWDDPADWEEFCEDDDGSKLLEEEELISKNGHRRKFVKKWRAAFGAKKSRNDQENEKKQDAVNSYKVTFHVPCEKREYPLLESKTNECHEDEHESKRETKKLFASPKHKVILVCGESGVGKSTLINSMMNYVYNVQYNDKFRLGLTTNSCTNHITSYTIKKPKGGNIDYDLTIIDTPGFGDNRGVQKDIQIFQEFKYVFNNILTDIDGICFVVKSSICRLDELKRKVFNNILNLFEKDVLENMFILMTCADGNTPHIIDSLNRHPLLKNIRKRFKINNSAFSSDKDFSNEDEFFDKMFWKIGMDCFKGFFDELNKLKPKSIEKSRKILEKHEIQRKIDNIFVNTNNILLKQKCINDAKKFIAQYENEMNAVKEVVYYQKVVKYEKFPVENNTVTICIRHQKSCHPGCDAVDKNECCMMNSDGYCIVCSCPASAHINANYEYRQVIQQVRKSNWDENSHLKDRFNKASENKQRVLNRIRVLENELKTLEQYGKNMN